LTVAAGLGFGILFVGRQRRLADPLLDLKLFANPMFASAVAGMFLMTVTGSMMLFVNQYLQLVLGLSPLVSGLWTLPGVIASVVGFLVAPILARKIRPGLLIGSGLIVAIAGVGLVLAASTMAGLVLLAAGFAIWNLGCAPMVTLASGIVMSSVEPEKAGSGAAINETFSEFGFALGIAVFGSIATMIYRAGIAGGIPADVPADQAALAADSLAGAVGVAHALAPETADVLLASARSAFMGGFGVVAIVTAALLAGVALIAFVMFRKLPPLGAEAAPAEEDSAEGEVRPSPAE
jgi:DHA2 family multidrug resistance protein-like MFS transporter